MTRGLSNIKCCQKQQHGTIRLRNKAWTNFHPMTNHPHSFTLPSFPLTSLVGDTPSSNGSGTSPHSGSTPSSSTYSGDLPPSLMSHRLPSVPSTFLPSYYPESRHTDTLPSHRPSTSGESSRYDPTADQDKSVASDPSNKHLLEGVAISPPRPPRNIVSPTYDLSPGLFSRDLPPVPRPWSSRSRGMWYETSIFDMKAGGEGGASPSQPHTRSGSPRDPTLSLESPHSRPPDNSRLSGSAPSPSMGPPASPHRRGSQSGQSLAPPQPSSRGSYSGTNLPEAVPQSASYPGMLYGSVSLAENGLLGTPSFGSSSAEGKVTGEDYAQVNYVPVTGPLCQSLT